jgi:hypothetical protein
MRKIGTEAQIIKEAIFCNSNLYEYYPKGTCRRLGFEAVDTTPLTEYFKVINSLRQNGIATRDEFEKYMEILESYDGVEEVDVIAFPKKYIDNLP